MNDGCRQEKPYASRFVLLVWSDFFGGWDSHFLFPRPLPPPIESFRDGIMFSSAMFPVLFPAFSLYELPPGRPGLKLASVPPCSCISSAPPHASPRRRAGCPPRSFGTRGSCGCLMWGRAPRFRYGGLGSGERGRRRMYCSGAWWLCFGMGGTRTRRGQGGVTRGGAADVRRGGGHPGPGREGGAGGGGRALKSCVAVVV